MIYQLHPRAIFVRTRSYIAWVRQGRPRDMPVVLGTGILGACPHGHGLVSGWSWDARFMSRPIHIDELVDRMTAQYQVERREFIAGCGACDRSMVDSGGSVS